MHKLLSKDTGSQVLLLGNEAIARGAIEAGVRIASTYPGTPSSEISNNLFRVSQESELYFQFSTNEKVALEVAAAAANSGVRSLAIMKHVGVNVARAEAASGNRNPKRQRGTRVRGVSEEKKPK